MSAIKNGIKELHCKESFSGKRFKRSIAHNNLKLTCNIYHIQVFKLPFLQIGLLQKDQDSSSLGYSKKQCSIRMRCPILFIESLSRFSSLEVCEWEARGSQHVGRGQVWGVGHCVGLQGVLNNVVFEKHLVHTTTINFYS